MSNNELRMLVGKLNGFCKTSLEGSAGLCLSRSHFYIEIEHWFLKILESQGNDCNSIFDYFGLDIEKVKRDLNKSLERLKTGNDHPPALSTYLVSLIKQAWLQASMEQSNAKVRSGHLLLALFKDDSLSMLVGGISPELEKINYEQLSLEFSAITESSDESAQALNQEQDPQVGKGTPALDQYTVDLTQQARDGELDPVLGREEEIRQLTDILTRRRQNNPILTGEAGVGKTSVIEGFASKIVANEVPEVLRNVSVRVLDMGLLQAGAGVKGEFENRLKNVIDEVKGSVEPIIVFIDEAHTMIGAGGSAGQNDAANLLKPALARGELRVIAATTWAEYKKYFEKDAALTRRFQVVKVEEPDTATAVAIMRGLTDVMENHHKVRILDEALVDSVKLSQRYIAGRQLPDKSVSLLDTACARVNLSQNSKPRQVEQLEKKLEEIVREVSILTKEADQETAHTERLTELELKQGELNENLSDVSARWQQERDLVGKINELMERYARATTESEEEEADEFSAESSESVSSADLIADIAQYRFDLEKLQGESPMVYPEVDSRVIAEVVSDWTGIPVGKMQKSSIGVSLNLEDTLSKRVVGQDSALKGIAKAMKTSSAKLMDPTKPIGVFLLAGPSGVGKTETAMALAEQMYGSEQNMTVINMSEFKEEHKVSLLMGSPPGYVGYGEGGVLTEAVRRKPYSVVLLDEIEKAHPGVQDIFYQVFDKGMLKDGEGRDIDFKNTLIIMTSNAGTETIMKLAEDPETMPQGDSLSKVIHEDLLKVFKPAFLGRATVLPYLPLGEEVLQEITKIQLGKVADRITDSYKIKCKFNKSVISSIVSRCNEVDSGARNIQKIINQSLLPELSEHFLNAMIEGREIEDLKISAKDGKFIFGKG